MVKISQIRFGQSVFVGDKEMNYIRVSGNPHIQLFYDEEHSRFVILNSKAKGCPEIWVYPTNVQFAEPMERSIKVADESNKDASKTRSPRA